VGEGLVVEIVAASLAEDGVATVTFEITDGGGRALDRDGFYTEGAVSLSFILAYLAEDDDGNVGNYVAYTAREVTSATSSDTAIQATSDSGGTYELVDWETGTYEYTFGTVATDPDLSLTHTVAVYATRTYEDVRYVDNVVYHFVPDGGAEPTPREIVTNEACSSCHGELRLHGGARRDVELCITCHSPQSGDPESGNTVDMANMVHRIHMGAELPSTAAGEPYQIVGFRGTVHDYSVIHYPNDVTDCATCHGDAADGARWADNPTTLACTGCHDRTYFTEDAPSEGTGWVEHSAGEAEDGDCAACHDSGSRIAPVTEAHLSLARRDDAPELAFAFDSIEDTGPGEEPTVNFTVTLNGEPYDMLANPLNRMRITWAGPTTDYQQFRTVTVQGSGSSGTLTAVNASAGRFRYVFADGQGIPDGAEGTYGFAVEGRYAGAVGSDFEGAFFDSHNPVAFAAVTDDEPVEREIGVTDALCLDCHGSMGAHGGARRDVAYCAFCHTPTNYGDERAARIEGESYYAHSVSLRTMIHGIHLGGGHSAPYVLGGFPAASPADPDGTQLDFAELVHFPGNIQDCGTCHVGGSEVLPMPAGREPALAAILDCTEDPDDDEDSYCNTIEAEEIVMAPITSVCTSCHDDASTAAHAATNTAPNGAEACVTCHGPGSAADAALYHVVEP
jgi:OmcA/MtrC family decaheme c-type cytochrome